MSSYIKRLIRLDPPYLITIIIVIILGYLSSKAPGFNGGPFHVTILQVMLHLGYINMFFGNEWLNPVFWTLAIEFQYYLAIGLLFPLVCSRNGIVRVGLIGVLGLLSFLLPFHSFIFHYLFLFMIGILTFQYWIGLVNIKTYLLLLVFLGIGTAFTLGVLVALVGIVSACAIAFVNIKECSAIKFFGSISYSLYLLHVPIGMRVINLSIRFAHGTSSKMLALAMAFGLSVITAYLLYKLVERPSQKLSSIVKYYPNKRLEMILDDGVIQIANVDSGVAADRTTA